MKRLLVAGFAVGLVMAAYAGSYLAHAKMPDGSIMTFELPNVPTPDSNGMYRFHNRNGGDWIVHASNVWIEEKSNKGAKKLRN